MTLGSRTSRTAKPELHRQVGRAGDTGDLRRLAEHEISPGRGSRILKGGARLVDQGFNRRDVRHQPEQIRVHKLVECAGPVDLGFVEAFEKRQDLGLQGADLAQRGHIVQRQPIDPFEAFPRCIRAHEQLNRDDLLPRLVGNPVQLRELGVDLFRRLGLAELAAVRSARTAS